MRAPNFSVRFGLVVALDLLGVSAPERMETLADDDREETAE